jgi:hypothetical protein
MYEHIFAETPEERAKRYRELARAAEETAARESLPSIQAAYVRSAERWNKLASLMELGTGYTARKNDKSETPKQPRKAKGWTIHKQRSELSQPALRYDSASHLKANDDKQGTAGMATGGGTGTGRAVLGRRGVLGRASPVRVTRARSA